MSRPSPAAKPASAPLAAPPAASRRVGAALAPEALNRITPETEGKPAPLTRFMENLWLHNCALHHKFEIASAGQRAAYIAWYIFFYRELNNSKNTTARPDAPLPADGPLTEWATRMADDGFWEAECLPSGLRPAFPLPMLLAVVWCQEKNIQRMFPIHKEEACIDFLVHMAVSVGPSVALPPAYLPDSIFEKINAPLQAAYAGNPRAVTRALHYAWRNHPAFARFPFQPEMKGNPLLLLLTLVASGHFDERLLPKGLIAHLGAPLEKSPQLNQLDADILAAAGLPAEVDLATADIQPLKNAITQIESTLRFPAALRRGSHTPPAGKVQPAVRTVDAKNPVIIYTDGTADSNQLIQQTGRIFNQMGVPFHYQPPPKSGVAPTPKDGQPAAALSIWHCAPRNFPELLLQHRQTRVQGQFRLGICPGGTLPDFQRSHDFGAALFDEIWTTNARDTASCSAAGVAAHTLGLAIDIPPESRQLTRRYFGLPENGFLAVSMVPTTALLAAANPMGAIDTFQTAFAGKSDACLALACDCEAPTTTSSNIVAQITEACRADPRIHLLPMLRMDEEIYGLLCLASAYVSLHRYDASGFLTLAAAACATPVVASDAFGNEDIGRHRLAQLVPCERVETDTDEICLLRENAVFWHEPDVAAGAALLRQAADTPDAARQQAKAAAEFVSRHYGLAAVTARAQARLAAIMKKG